MAPSKLRCHHRSTAGRSSCATPSLMYNVYINTEKTREAVRCVSVRMFSVCAATVLERMIYEMWIAIVKCPCNVIHDSVTLISTLLIIIIIIIIHCNNNNNICVCICTGMNFKVGGAPEFFFRRAPPLVWVYKYKIVVLVSAFVMGSTAWSVSWLLFTYSWCPPCPAICRSRRHCMCIMCLWCGWCTDLRKRFEQEPINTHVEASSSIQLQCLPPSGLPAPQVGLSSVVHRSVYIRLLSPGQTHISDAQIG